MSSQDYSAEVPEHVQGISSSQVGQAIFSSLENPANEPAGGKALQKRTSEVNRDLRTMGFLFVLNL